MNTGLSSMSSDDEGALGSIMLPSSLFQQVIQDNDEISILFGAFTSPALFQEGNPANSDFSVASSIVSATIHGHEEANNLNDDVVIMMTLLSEVCIM